MAELPSETLQFLLKPTVQPTTQPNKNNYPHPFSQPTICVFFCLELMDKGGVCVCVSFIQPINQSTFYFMSVHSKLILDSPLPRPLRKQMSVGEFT